MKWNPIFGLLLVVCCDVWRQIAATSECSADGECDEEGDENKYSEVANFVAKTPEEYLTLIANATKNHVACSGCDCYNDFLKQEFSSFTTVSRSTLDKIREVVRHAVTYQIIDGKLYRSKECLFPMRCEGIEHFLLKLAKRMKDTEFVVNMHDWPYMNKYFEKTPLPLFSFSKSKDYHDISYPAWSFWAGGPATDLYPKGLGRWDEFRTSLQSAAITYPWDKKQEIAFFRGSRTSNERDSLVTLSRKMPDLVDSSYTKNQAYKSEKDTLNAPPAKEVSMEDHCKYKYLFNYRGVAASFRFRHLFLCGSLVVQVGDEWLEFFYSAMQPWVHYVPLSAKATEEEIKELLLFLKDNDSVAHEIAERGKEFVRTNLRMEDVECYWKRLLEEYTKLLNFQPEVNEEFERIKNKNQKKKNQKKK